MFETTFTIDFRQGNEVKFTVYDADGQGFFNEEIGYYSLPLANVLNYSGMETAYPLQHSDQDRQMQLIEAQAAVLVLATVTKLDYYGTTEGTQMRLSENPTHLPNLVKRLEELINEVNKTVEQTRMEFKTVNDTCNSLKRDLKHLEEDSSRKNKMLETQVKSLLRYREEMNARDDELENSLSGTKKKSVIGTSTATPSGQQCASCSARQQEVIKVRKEIDQIRNSHICALCANELRKQYKQTEDDTDDFYMS